MKVFISSDMEGTAGLVDWEQCSRNGSQYVHAVELLTAEINAAIEGAIDAGATEFLVNDSHSVMTNLRPDALAGRARYLSGRYKPMYMMEGLDDSFDAVFLVSYHGSASSHASALSHTYYSPAVAEVRINDVVAGESGVNALVAGAYGVPVSLVTGDQVTAEETRRFCPGVQAAVVKRSVSRYAADSLHPSVATELIHDRARTAIERLDRTPAPEFASPTELTVTFRSSDYLELACRIHGVRPATGLSARITAPDTLELYRRFVTVVFLCRSLPG
ncbi:M55 family metallopeptidase [Streptomyces sp. NPDC004629]|uniref:M55 family metallopeptidase n=1 Tax=Streptomyces sp. NPDC004629 TaxID=3364705 RepID=UPI00368B2955